MVKRNLSQSTYVWLDIVPAILLVFSPLVFTSILYIIQWIISLFSSKGAATVLKKIMQLILKTAAILFGPPEGVLRYDQEPKESPNYLNTREVYIRRKKVPPIWVMHFGLFGVFFGLFAAFVFWDIFLLAETHDCDDTTIDCFLDKPIGNYSKGFPITDCGLFEDFGNNATITCYTFTFNFGAGLAAVGGLITMIRIVMKMISVTFITMYENTSDKCGCCKYNYLCLICTHGLLILVFPTVFTIVFTQVDLSFLSTVNIVQVSLFMLTLFFGFMFPWCCFVGDDVEDRNDGESDESKKSDGNHYMQPNVSIQRKYASL